MDPTILYVDDQQENLDGFRFTFRKNYTIYTALTAAEGFKILEGNEISIVISDQRMPDILGTEFLNQVSQRFPHAIRIILTAFADFDAVVGAINKGQVYRFLTKPWNRDEMRMTIENAHEAYLLRKENLKLIQDLQNANESLNSNNILLQKEIEERKIIERELQNHRDNLEKIVAERTKQLAASNEELGAINEELQEVNDHLSIEIDQRKAFQVSLVESEKKFRSFVEQSSQGAALIDRSGRVLEWNNSMELILGSTKESVSARPVWESGLIMRLETMKTDGTFESIKEKVKIYIENINSAKAIEFEGQSILASGKRQFVQITLFPIITDNMAYAGVFVIDMTERRQAEDEILNQATALEELNAEYQSLNEELNTYNEELKTVNDSLRIEIEKRKKTEKLLAESEMKFRSFIEQSGEGIMVADESGKVIEWNKASVEMFGLSKDTVLGRYSWDVDYKLLPKSSQNEDNYKELKNSTLSILQSPGENSTRRIEEQRISSEGNTVDLMVTIFPIITENASYLGSIGRDITMRKQVELKLVERTDELESLNEEYLAINEELQTTNYEISVLNDSLKEEISKREIAQLELSKHRDHLEELVELRTQELLTTEARLQTLSDNLPGGAIFRGYTDEKKFNHMVYASKGVEEISGISIDRLKESMDPFFERIHPEDSKIFEGASMEGENGVSILDIVFRYSKTEGEISWIQLRTMYSKGSDGLTWWDGYASDITERKRAEEQAKEQEIIFKNLQELIAPVTGEKLFDTLLLNIESILHTHSLYVAEYMEELNLLRSISFSRQREIHDNFEYFLENTPSQKILSDGIVAYSSGITKAFPNDEPLAREGISGYVGVALTDSEGNNIGVVVAASKTEIPNLDFAIQILRVFSVRIGAELLRIKKDRELKEREERFSTLFDLSPNMQIITNARAEIVEANKSFLRNTGYSREEVIGGNTVDLLKWGRREAELLNEQYLKYGKVDNFAAYFTSKQGEKRNLLLSVAPILIKGEKHRIASGVDISERILAEQKLAESEERFRAILQNLSDSIWIIDDKSVILYESPSARNMLGYKEGELQGRVGFELVHPEDMEVVREEFGRALNKIEGNTPTLFRVRTAAGNYIYVEGISSNRLEHPAIKGIILTLRDVTERIAKDRALSESEQKFRNIFNNSTDAIIISSLDQKILEVNDVVVKLAGFSREELLKKKTTELATEKSQKEINSRFARLKAEEALPPTEVDFIIGTGELLATEMTSRVIDYEGNKAMLTLIRDITERKKLEKVLIDTIIQTEEKEREQMAADLHDEVGPLLSSMKMYLNSLVETKDAAKSLYIADQLQILIKESITAVREISNDLSPHILNNYGLSAAVRAAVETNMQFVSINVKENLENKRFSPNIEIIFYRIIRELINNTIKHAGAKNIDISLYHSEDNMMLYYSDNGKGFDWNMVINSTRKGLGLMNILSRVKSMNGHYSIQTSPGKGFYFELTTPL